MSNPLAEVYKDLRSEILNESDLQERRKLRGDIKTAATQTRYDLKSRVAKMRAQGKTDLEIKQYLDKYIANSKLPGEQKAQIRQVALSSGYELEGQQIAEESEKVLVRITTEDGRVFEKKVPREKISDLRKRYKTVVEVGSSEKAPTQTSNKPGGVSEGKHVKRWWDDDGDGKGYEDGEVSGKFKKKKKKIKSESFSDWRYEIQIDENQIGLTPKEMRPSAEEKKNEGESESKLSEHNDTNTWEESDRELANRLAEELGAEVLGVEVLDERIRIPKIPSPRVVTQFMDKIDDVIPNLRLGREPAGAMVPVKPTPAPAATPKPTPAPAATPKPTPAPAATPKPTPAPAATPKPTPAPLTAVEKAELQRLQSTSIKDGNPNRSATLSTGRKIENIAQVKVDTKTGAITSAKPEVKTGTLTAPKPPKPDVKTGTLTAPQTQTQTQTGPKTRIPIPPPPTRTGGPGPGPGPILKPPIKIPFALPAIGEPKNVGKVVKV
jgi:uncharacterized protein YktA (UPF0223 family)